MRSLLLFLTGSASAAPYLPPSLPETGWRLPPRTPENVDVSRDQMLPQLEAAVRAVSRLQDPSGAIIDPLVEREFQYATPYFAHAVGTLLRAGRAADLLPAGLRAMDHATKCFAGGRDAIPDQHGEFYLATLVEALEAYAGIAPSDQWTEWQSRLRTPLAQVIKGYRTNTNNWRTYAMRGEWLRVKAGLVPREPAVDFIERSWTEFQRDRLVGSTWNLYLDRSSDPNSQAVEAVGRGNLIGLLAAGYDGPSAAEMQRLVDRATRMSLLLQDPTGQAPPNGRTDNHVWNDILYQLCFEVAAEQAHARGEITLASQYRRAASLAFLSALRWQRPDGAFQITKNFFPNELRTGYQPASQWTNYNGAVLTHLAEAWHARRSALPDAPAPAEIGGYAFANDPQFASAFANAGGMQVMINLRGEIDPAKYNIYWTPLGVARFSRSGWDSGLGPADGVRDTHSRQGVSFGPTWKEGDQWVRLASVPERYEGAFTADLATPALVQCRVVYKPRLGGGGPTFVLHFTITPEGILIRQQGDDATPSGFTLPLMIDDGRTRMQTRAASGIVSAAHPVSGDEQAYLVPGEAEIDGSGDAIRSPVGWLKPVRIRASSVFVYPRRREDPVAAVVRAGLRLHEDGFDSPLVSVRGTVAIGRTYAGGVAQVVDLDGDGRPEWSFDRETGFTARLESGRVAEIETDRVCRLMIAGREFDLKAHEVIRVLPRPN